MKRILLAEDEENIADFVSRGLQSFGYEVDSVRRGEVPGIHSITWNSEADQITITHDAHNRRGFALGAVLAAEYTAQHTGFLTMNDLFDF